MLGNPAWKKGVSGNPAGRPKGARHKLTESFWTDFHKAWQTHGKAALASVAEDDPSTFVRVAATLMPKEAEITLRNITAREIPDDELADIAVGSGEGVDSPSIDPAQLN